MTRLPRPVCGGVQHPGPWLALGLLTLSVPAWGGPSEEGLGREQREREQRPRRAVPDEPRPFDRGSMDLNLALGLSAGGETAFSLGAGFGYFIVAGLEPGLELELTFGSERPTVVSLLPYLRFFVYRSTVLSPYLKLQGGRHLVSGQDDLTAVGGGGGLVLFVTRHAALQLEGLVFRLFPEEACGESCTASSVGLSLGFYFGGPPVPRAPAPPAPAETMEPAGPPPADAEPHEAEPRDEPVPWER